MNECDWCGKSNALVKAQNKTRWFEHLKGKTFCKIACLRNYAKAVKEAKEKTNRSLKPTKFPFPLPP